VGIPHEGAGPLVEPGLRIQPPKINDIMWTDTFNSPKAIPPRSELEVAPGRNVKRRVLNAKQSNRLSQTLKTCTLSREANTGDSRKTVDLGLPNFYTRSLEEKNKRS